jgi:hypothetical protein
MSLGTAGAFQSGLDLAHGAVTTVHEIFFPGSSGSTVGCFRGRQRNDRGGKPVPAFGWALPSASQDP